MDNDMLAVTGRGLFRISPEAGDWQVRCLLDDDSVQCAAVHPDDPSTIYVGTRGHGVRVSRDAGASWTGSDLPETDVFSLAVSSADGRVWAGTEPSRLFVSTGGESWRELEALQDIPSRSQWSFPPRPHTSHVRSIAPHPSEPDRLIVGIELGGLMLSTDGGASFRDHRPGAQKDVHALAWHPRETDRAFEAGGGGAAFSTDAAETWQPADDGLDLRYTWALAVDPADADCWYVSAAPGPRRAHGSDDASARIYRKRGNQAWEPISDTLASMPYALLHTGEWLVAGLDDGSLMRWSGGSGEWTSMRTVGDSISGIRYLLGG